MRYQELRCAFETKDEKDDTASFSGVASTADLDSQNDIIEAGAFDPIARKASGEPDVLMLRDHDRSQVIGGWTRFAQQGPALHVEGTLCLAVEKARETYALLKQRFLSGLSVGYNIPDRAGIKYDDRNGRRIIKKAVLRECSIVALPANRNARVLNVKSEIADTLEVHGLCEVDVEIMRDSGLGDFPNLEQKDAQKPWGDVDYADPGYQDDSVHRYPIHTARNIRAAWSYINMPKNQRPYTAEQVAKIKKRIIAAWKDKIDSAGPPSASDKSDDLIPPFLDPPTDEMRIASEVRGLLSQMKGRCHV